MALWYFTSNDMMRCIVVEGSVRMRARQDRESQSCYCHRWRSTRTKTRNCFTIATDRNGSWKDEPMMTFNTRSVACEWRCASFFSCPCVLAKEARGSSAGVFWNSFDWLKMSHANTKRTTGAQLQSKESKSVLYVCTCGTLPPMTTIMHHQHASWRRLIQFATYFISFHITPSSSSSSSSSSCLTLPLLLRILLTLKLH